MNFETDASYRVNPVPRLARRSIYVSISFTDHLCFGDIVSQLRPVPSRYRRSRQGKDAHRVSRFLGVFTPSPVDKFINTRGWITDLLHCREEKFHAQQNR
jgi:hypothetical protein